MSQNCTLVPSGRLTHPSVGLESLLSATQGLTSPATRSPQPSLTTSSHGLTGVVTAQTTAPPPAAKASTPAGQS